MLVTASPCAMHTNQTNRSANSVFQLQKNLVCQLIHTHTRTHTHTHARTYAQTSYATRQRNTHHTHTHTKSKKHTKHITRRPRLPNVSQIARSRHIHKLEYVHEIHHTCKRHCLPGLCVCVCVYVCVCVCVYVCVCVCVCMCVLCVHIRCCVSEVNLSQF